MTAQAKRRDRSPLKIPVIVVAVVVVFLFILAGFRINETSTGYSYDYGIRDYLYATENGRFGELYDSAIHDMDKQATHSAEVDECRALAFYYEQALLEHAYRASGDTVKADAFAKRMQEYEAQLGSLASKAKAVREAVENWG